MILSSTIVPSFGSGSQLASKDTSGKFRDGDGIVQFCIGSLRKNGAIVSFRYCTSMSVFEPSFGAFTIEIGFIDYILSWA